WPISTASRPFSRASRRAVAGWRPTGRCSPLSAGEGWEMWKQSTSTFSPDSRLLCGRVSVSSSAEKEDFERGEHDVWEVTSGKRLVRLQAQQLESVKVSCHMPTLLGPGPPMKSMPKAGAFTGYSPASVCGAWFL